MINLSLCMLQQELKKGEMCGEREKVSVRDSDANSPLPMESSRCGSALRGGLEQKYRGSWHAVGMLVCFESLFWGDGCPDPFPGMGQKQFLLPFISTGLAVTKLPPPSASAPAEAAAVPRQVGFFLVRLLGLGKVICIAECCRYKLRAWSCLLRLSPVRCLWDAWKRCSVIVTKNEAFQVGVRWVYQAGCFPLCSNPFP